jgi:hypothetical protein
VGNNRLAGALPPASLLWLLALGLLALRRRPVIE